MKERIQRYGKWFSEKALKTKLGRYASKAGVKTVYTVLLLYYAYQRKETPRWAKNIVLGALGYFLAPIDALPDLAPIVGYTDDIGVLGFGLVTVAAYVNKEVKDKARTRLKAWFKTYEEADLAEVDKRI
jgi:uncharacterized membrane protein YkvA (DUF1232 family)